MQFLIGGAVLACPLCLLAHGRELPSDGAETRRRAWRFMEDGIACVERLLRTDTLNTSAQRMKCLVPP